ncbi:hypothetical protein NBO_1307g0001 [Nosema bombycis CQ1]|uniref:Uncharacterized protein n=1 Tax=Nosema bombycis (strain CQ1 / CVCC 102059) TaxID=578461 RepID=R0MB82_NOSB1|nr:hypothetical protein NBO_1307g0001 [Nosema bombycis CQ1]|eukprot:EOB11290.1 hypothetical protein NBO_1307g0001 [Nosema bombycis CQ1]
MTLSEEINCISINSSTRIRSVSRNWFFLINNPVSVLNPEVVVDCNYIRYQLNKTPDGIFQFQGVVIFLKPIRLYEVKDRISYQGEYEIINTKEKALNYKLDRETFLDGPWTWLNGSAKVPRECVNDQSDQKRNKNYEKRPRNRRFYVADPAKSLKKRLLDPYTQINDRLYVEKRVLRELIYEFSEKGELELEEMFAPLWDRHPKIASTHVRERDLKKDIGNLNIQ